MQDGDRNPVRDSAASADARRAAVSAALAEAPEETGEGQEPSAAEPSQSQPSREPDAATQEPPAKSVPSSSAAEGQTDPAVPSTQLEAPKHWPQARRDAFATLPENAKSILIEREKEFNAGLTKNAQENAEHRKRSEAVQQVFNAEHRQQMAHAGIDEVGAVRQLVSLHDFFTRDPVGYLKHLIQATGASQDQLFGGQKAPQQQANEQAQPDEWVDPMVLEVRSQNEALRGELQALKQSLGQFQQQHSQREQLTLQEEIQAFQTAVDSSGQPVRPHYAAVMPIMKHLIDTDPEVAAIPDWKAQEKLQKAYDKAVWMNPEIRQQLIESQVNQSLSTQLNQAALDRAKAAATRKPSPGANGLATAGRMTRQEAVAAALRETGQA